MKKIILTLFSLTLAMVATVVNSAPVNVTLLTDNQRSSSGTLSNLSWKACPGPTYPAPCVNPTNSWVIANSVTGSTATWTWDAATGILASTGVFWATSYISSNPAGLPVISDKTVDLVINTSAGQTNAANYVCIEGEFLVTVGANGCGNYNLIDFINDSTVAYNVDPGTGPSALCVVRTLGGDDESTGNPRGPANTDGSIVGCDPTDGAYLQYNVIFDTTGTAGGQLRLADDNAGAPWPVSCFDNPATQLPCAGATFLTFQVSPTAVDDSAGVDPTGTTPIAVMANDVGFTDDVTVTVATPPTQGTAVVSGSPGPQAGITIGYTPNVGATGTDTFVYTATDADGVTSDSATVTVTILQNGANPDSATTTRNTPIDIDVAANDIGFATPVTITITTPPDQGGTAAPSVTAGVVSYTPATIAAGAPGYTETFTYQITDGTVTGTAVVTVTVNNAQVVAGDTGVTISTAGTAPGTVTNEFDAGTAPNSLGNEPSEVTATQGANGTTDTDGSVVTYTPAATFFQGTDTYTYTITDSDPGTPKTATGTVTVTIPDVVPTIANGTITTTAGTAGTTTLATTLGNGSSAQNVRTVSAATSGTCVLGALTATGTPVTYTPGAGFTGSDSCVVTIKDEGGAGAPVTATVSVTVNASGGGGGGGGGGSGPQLPPASGSLDLWSLSLLAGASWLRRKRQFRAPARG